jgi:hypothetical protein
MLVSVLVSLCRYCLDGPVLRYYAIIILSAFFFFFGRCRRPCSRMNRSLFKCRMVWQDCVRWPISATFACRNCKIEACIGIVNVWHEIWTGHLRFSGQNPLEPLPRERTLPVPCSPHTIGGLHCSAVTQFVVRLNTVAQLIWWPAAGTYSPLVEKTTVCDSYCFEDYRSVGCPGLIAVGSEWTWQNSP